MVMETLSAEDLLGPLNEFEAKHAPDALYVRGDKNILRQGARVSIVGSRKATPFGLARARKLAAMLAERNIVVVSGLAEGIDTAAMVSCPSRPSKQEGRGVASGRRLASAGQGGRAQRRIQCTGRTGNRVARPR